jgi:hypothetical protein
LAAAVGQALGKMQRSLTTFFGRRGRPAATISGPFSKGMKTSRGAKKKAAVKKASVKKPTTLRPRGPKKKRIYQARRKSWPTR